MLKDDLPPSGVAHTQLGVAQPWSTNLRVYKPCSINVSVPSPPTVNVPPVTSVPYTLSVGSTRGSEAFAKAAGTTFTGPITSVAGEPTVPMPSVHRRGVGRLRLGREREVLVRDRLLDAWFRPTTSTTT